MYEDKWFLKTIFKNKMYSIDGNEFQKFVEMIYFKKHKNFKKVKPYGNIGDRSNDGFLEGEGIFLQVYGPQDIRLRETEEYTINKLKKNFDSLLTHCKKNNWEKIKEFRYIVNDKFYGFSPNLYNAIRDIKEENNIEADLIGVDELYKQFCEFDLLDMIDILGYVPDSSKIDYLDFSILGEIFVYLSKNVIAVSEFDGEPSLKFHEKIKLNNLKPFLSLSLTKGWYYNSYLKEFFNNNISIENLEDRIERKMKNLYEEALKEGEEKDSNHHLLHIMSNLIPEELRENENFLHGAIGDYLFAITSYYFEPCSILKS